MRVVIIAQARMGSTRLPGKVLKPLLGQPMLARQLERLTRCRWADDIVVATTDRAVDDPIIALVDELGTAHSFRGPEDDVLARYLGAASKHEAEVVVRVTADCPLIDPGVLDNAITAYIEHHHRVAYVTNGVKRTYPRGLDVEVFPLAALQTAAAEATAAGDREHVTPFLWRQPERFPRFDLVAVEDNSDLRWTVDTQEDYELVTRIYEVLYPGNPQFTYTDVLALVRAHPELTRINQQVTQKEA